MMAKYPCSADYIYPLPDVFSVIWPMKVNIFSHLESRKEPRASRQRLLSSTRHLWSFFALCPWSFHSKHFSFLSVSSQLSTLLSFITGCNVRLLVVNKAIKLNCIYNSLKHIYKSQHLCKESWGFLPFSLNKKNY